MVEKLTNMPHPLHRLPLLLIIMDGVGLAPASEANAYSQAKTPCLDQLTKHCVLQTTLKTHGPAVGLPSWSDMGNSEVGHNALGAGRIVDQGATLVANAIKSGALFNTATWSSLVACGRSQTLHLIGLLSEGNVHAHLDHLLALIENSAQQGVKKVALHLLLDGRDVPPRSALEHLAKLELVIERTCSKFDIDICIASGGGRMQVTMDRYNADWSIVERGWRAHVLGQARAFQSAKSAIETMYREDAKIIDQNLQAFVVTDNRGEPLAPIIDGDGVLFFNFRGDRAIEISQAFEEEDFRHFDRQRLPHVTYAGMMLYDGDLNIPKNYLVAAPRIESTFSEFICAAGMHSFAISETQKYGHVTYFWNGNRSGKISESLEEYVEIPSDRVPFETKPEMQAEAITAKTIELLQSGRFAFGRVNFPNGDMVGHTGDLQAAIEAVEVVDRSIDKLMAVMRQLGGITIILADHGNCEEMFEQLDGVRQMKTSHTLNPVPLFIVDPQYNQEYSLATRDDANLGHVASTMLEFLGMQPPKIFQPSLLKW